MEDCLTFFGGTSIFYSRGNKFKKLLLSLYLSHKRKPANPTLILSPLGYSWGWDIYPRLCKPSKKIQKTANFVRNQQLNMVARTGLEPAASGLWVIASVLQPSIAQYTVYAITSYVLYIVCTVACRILYLHRKEQIKNNVCTATISFPPGNRQLDSAMQNSYTKGNKRALSTDG